MLHSSSATAILHLPPGNATDECYGICHQGMPDECYCKGIPLLMEYFLAQPASTLHSNSKTHPSVRALLFASPCTTTTSSITDWMLPAGSSSSSGSAAREASSRGSAAADTPY
eukprot:scaffold299375_cov22-Tisochrysis_lutea.AAC.1